MKDCKINGCNKNCHSNGYCQKHYTQMRQHGRILKRTIYDKNKIIIHLNYAEIEIYNKKCEPIAYTKIDLEDVKKVKDYKWKLHQGYAYTHLNRKKYLSLADHLLTFKGNHKIHIDHKNRDRLDNRKANLRIVTSRQNAWNRKHKLLSGVSFNKKPKTWSVRVGRHNFLGTYKTIEEAVGERIIAEEVLNQEGVSL